MSKLKTKKYNAVANAEKDASQTFVKGAAILTLSMVIVKVFGLLDKVILTGIFSGVSFEQAVAGGTKPSILHLSVWVFTVMPTKFLS